jgi:transposase
LIAGAGASVLYLPAYSPDFNPIELCWSKLKTILKSLGPRTEAALEYAVQVAGDLITRADARNWFRHCGYVRHQAA